MTDPEQPSLADQLYAEGMAYNWRHGESPSNSALARANLERSAALGHSKALRELAEMMFAGAGGPKDPERAIWLKWSAFVCGDRDALDEVSALMETYAEMTLDAGVRRRVEAAAVKADQLLGHIRSVESVVFELLHKHQVAPPSE